MCEVFRSLTLFALMLRVDAVRDLALGRTYVHTIARVLQSVPGMWIKAQLRFPRNREANIVYNAQRRTPSLLKNSFVLGSGPPWRSGELALSLPSNCNQPVPCDLMHI